MANKDTRLVLKEYDKVLIWLSLAVTLLLIVVYVFFDDVFPNASSKTTQFFENLAIELIPIGITFIISYLVFRKIQEIKEKQSVSEMSQNISNNLIPQLTVLLEQNQNNRSYALVDFPRIEWDGLLSGAMRVDIIVHYFDTWIRNNDSSLEAVFRRGGTIRLVIPNSENKSLIKQIKKRFPEYDEREVKTKVQTTRDKLQRLKERANKGKLEVYITNDLGYYCGIRIDERTIIHSSYDHIRESMKIAAPTFIIQIEKEPHINEWFEKELSFLISEAQRGTEEVTT